MLGAVSDQTRTGVSDNHAVANFYQLDEAAPQVIMGTLLAANTPAGTLVASAGSAPTQKPWTVEEMLEQKISVSFDQEPLHFAGSTVVDEVNNVRPKGTPKLNVVLLGNDLQNLSGGRFILGLGAQVKAHIEKRFGTDFDPPAARMRDYIKRPAILTWLTRAGGVGLIAMGAATAALRRA